MAKKNLTKIEREIRDHPERFDFGDIPADRKVSAAQKAAEDALAPDWVKQSKANRDDLERAIANAKIEIDDFKANFETRGKLSD